jgi:hypothetical protein
MKRNQKRYDANRIASVIRSAHAPLPSANTMYRQMLLLNTGSRVTDQEALEVFTPFPGGEQL